MKPKLSAIIDALQLQSDEMTAYINIESGDVLIIQDEYVIMIDGDNEGKPQWMKDVIAEVEDVRLNQDRYFALPSQWNLNRYQTMAEFCKTQTNPKIEAALSRAIEGKGAFRRFKNTAINLDVVDAWYKFEEQAIKEFAIEWCRSNDIDYLDDGG